MKRLLYNQLVEWKYSKNRKPLLLQGARQIGKTYLVNQFDNEQYQITPLVRDFIAFLLQVIEIFQRDVKNKDI